MKKVLIAVAALFSLIALCGLCGCNGTPQKISCYVPDGAPSLAVANVIDSKKIGGADVETTVTTGEDVVAKCAVGEADMAVLPMNAAVKICSQRNDYLLYSVNVMGLLYVVGTEQITELSDIFGTVYSIGLGNTPEYVFKKILDVKGVNYASSGGISLEYMTDASTIIPLFLQGKANFAVLGEPAVTNLIAKAASQNKTVYRLFDLQQLWQEATSSDSAGYPQAGIIVKRSLLDDKTFAQNLKEAVFSNNRFLQQNIARLNALMQGAGSSLDVNYTAEIIERCNLTAVFAKEAKTDIEKYLQTFSAMQQFLPLTNEIFYEAND